MRRISEVQERFEAATGEKILVTVEAKSAPHNVTFSDDAGGPVFTAEQDPPPKEIQSFVMSGADTSFTIVYRFPPPAVRDPKAHYVVTFRGKDGTSDGPNKIRPLSAVNTVTQLYEFRAAGAVPARALTRAMPGSAAIKAAGARAVKKPKKPGKR